jgi:hypothetical protein
MQSDFRMCQVGFIERSRNRWRCGQAKQTQLWDLEVFKSASTGAIEIPRDPECLHLAARFDSEDSLSPISLLKRNGKKQQGSLSADFSSKEKAALECSF